MYTNINISNNIDQFKYVIEYIEQDGLSNLNLKYLNNLKIHNEYVDDIIFINNENDYLNNNNHWCKINNEEAIHDYIPQTYKEGFIRLYFPDFSIDNYHSGHKYALTVNTWICGHKIILGTYIITRHESLACDKFKKFFNENYYEYIDFPILDPLDLIYSDNWSEWRKQVCGESIDPSLINSVGSVLCCSLHPVMISDNDFIKLDGYTGGQNYINITQDSNDFLNLSISTNTNKSLNGERPSIQLNLNFNKYYEGSLYEYLKETYGLNNCKIEYELIIGNETDIYSINNSGKIDLINMYKFVKDEINKENFLNGLGWTSGIYIVGSANIIDLENNESVIYLLSNKLPFTENILKYFIKTDFIDNNNNIINDINLDELNMNIMNINAINKIENKIIKIDRGVTDNKSNIYQTTFYRTTDTSNIVIRPEINENVCINLDSYKHLVKSFILQIEGIKFLEIGRIKSGVIFKVIGNHLPNKISSGRYYILNQDYEYITGGKYNYEI